MAKKKRNRIRYCFEDYLKTITASERERYEEEFKPLIALILASADDDEVMDRVRQYDTLHGTDLFAEVLKFKIYCIVCHRVDCIC